MNTSLFFEMDQHLVDDVNPSVYFESLGPKDFSEFPFNLLQKLKSTPQSPLHHPEGSAWNHTLLVVDQAAKRKEKSSEPRIFLWAALLHDIGKPDTTSTRKGRITSYGHEKVGAVLAKRFIEPFEQDDEFVRRVTALVRWHMQPLHVVKSLPFADVKTMKSEISIEDVALLGLCDRLGRTGADEQKEEESIRIFLDRCRKA